MKSLIRVKQVFAICVIVSLWACAQAPVTGDTRVIITPAPGDKAIIVDAPRRMIEDIVRLAKSLDTPDALGRFEIRTYKLVDTTSAADVARSLANVFAKSASRSSSRGRYGSSTPTSRTNEPRFEADAASNVLIVSV